MKNTLSFLVQFLLQKSKRKIDLEELGFQIQRYSLYSSMNSITGVLHHSDKDKIAIYIDKETLNQLQVTI